MDGKGNADNQIKVQGEADEYGDTQSHSDFIAYKRGSDSNFIAHNRGAHRDSDAANTDRDAGGVDRDASGHKHGHP